jgi:hypothetical protein
MPQLLKWRMEAKACLRPMREEQARWCQAAGVCGLQRCSVLWVGLPADPLALPQAGMSVSAGAMSSGLRTLSSTSLDYSSKIAHVLCSTEQVFEPCA